ncbi:MAG: hypothetical protein AEth_01233 [Candidatus Argoarchaeum ethanivorans]|uniref:Uncharacterized protein n=1 Tax=Candidatus Argoarchaeum ethanivorans TaxID=2608793 RepID=A0A8B3S2E1_9EURY|nr:MAG: hypothetical protein AEth_01233 [Candidatus Argoarchaeum ethanivorans]
MNKINSALLALALISMLCGTASAVYEWEQVNEEGFGDLTNDYAWAMHEYNNYLYVGTLNTNFSHPPSALNDGLEIWRSPSGDPGTWEQVLGPSGTQLLAHPITGDILPARAGFYTGCLGARGMEVYKNLLWVGTSNPFFGCQIWVTNGTHWKRANNPGFGGYLNWNANNTATRGIIAFNGTIYAEAQNTKEGAGVWKYTGPTDFDSIGTLVNQSKWVPVNMPGFGEPATNVGIGELIRFDPLTDGENIEYLYAGTWNISDTQLAQMLLGDVSYLVGCQVWRTNGTVDPSESPRLIWEKVMDGGFGDPQNGGITSSTVFDNALYMGTGNLADQAEVWRTTDGIDWEPVTTTGFLESGGFGTVYMWRMVVYKDRLVVGTFNPTLGGQVWGSTSGHPHTFEQVNVNGMNGERKLPAFNFGGFTIYGIDQYGIRSFAVFNDSLYLGTASWGDWVDRYAGTNYSKYVGCEVWRCKDTQVVYTVEPTPVPALTPIGMLALIGAVGLILILGTIRRRED